jgi:hypothetical protein
MQKKQEIIKREPNKNQEKGRNKENLFVVLNILKRQGWIKKDIENKEEQHIFVFFIL